MNTDADVVRRLNQIQWTKPVSHGVSDALIPLAASIPVALYVQGMVGDNSFNAESGLGLALTNLTALGIAFSAKQIINRDRPWRRYSSCIDAGRIDNEGSFPSGHAAGAAAMATYLSLRYPKWYVIVPSLFYAVYTDYARMNLGMHYPSDILAGTLIGLGVGYLGYRITPELRKSFGSILPSLYTAGASQPLILCFTVNL
jgi:membrane-associated phospholipid phosphatase